MKLEERVCSLESAKRLNELKVKQNSYWFWVESKRLGIDWNPKPYHVNLLDKSYSMGQMDVGRYSAFTVAECLEIYKEEMIIPKGLTNIADFIAQKIIDKVEEL